MKMHDPAQLVESAEEALEMLKEGNLRYVESHLSSKDCYCTDRDTLKNEQHPFAVVLCCSDSRVAPEIFFDQRLGDLFVIRNAGNISDDTVLGSIEYAVQHLKTPLVVICGHSSCGAVTAAFDGGDLPPHIQSIADHIKPAVDLGGELDEVIHHNVEVVMEQIEQDDIIKDIGVTIVGAYYDICTGVVTWL